MSPTYTQHQTISFSRDHNITSSYLKPVISRIEDQENHWMFSGSAPDAGGEGNDLKPSVQAAAPPLENSLGPYPTRGRDDLDSRPGLGARMKSAEQLPPLSSIFQDSCPRISLPSHSRASNAVPSFTPDSQRNAQQHSTARSQQQQWEEPPYLRPVSQPSQQYAYSRPPHSSTTSELPPPPRAQYEQSKPSSPGYFDPARQETKREREYTSSGPWPPRTEQSYRDQYHSAATSPYDHPIVAREPAQHRSHMPQSISSSHDSNSARQHEDMTILQSSGRYDQHSGSQKSARSTCSKTNPNLGPKIWTGTHFLPRFVGEKDVPGEGMCYFYDDGTYCKTVIDDEPVTPHWGVTKAGKPRKRLAIACITCREKKIKCDPDYPRCVQCEKFGRVCKFKNAPRGGHNSPDASSADADEFTSRSVSDLAEFESVKHENSQAHYSNANTQPNSPRRELELSDVKRRRSGYTTYAPAGLEKREAYLQDKPSPTRSQHSPILHQESLNWCAMQASNNPFDTDRTTSLGLLEIFFAHISGSTYCFLPEYHFRRWVCEESPRKSRDDLVLIYAVLAMATTYTTPDRDDMKTKGSEYAAIARYAATGREFSLQLVQTRLLLSLYYYAINIFHEAWDYSGGALRTALGMNLNLELSNAELQSAPTVYNLNKNGYAECRRRTFWSCYLMDHFTGFCNNALSTISPEDIFLRVPAKTKHFESQSEFLGPFFDSARIPIPDVLENAGVMAYLVNICSIWGDVRANIYRSSQASASISSEPFSTFYTNINMRLDAWRTSLPENLKFTAENLDSKLNLAISGSFMTMHSIYHVTHVKLNRYLKQESVSPYQLEHSIRLTYQHSNAIFKLADIVATRTSRMAHSPAAQRPFSSLYTGFAVLVAVDVMTAKGYLSEIPALRHRLEGAKRIIDELANFWFCARKQQFMLAQRIEMLNGLERGGGGWNATNGTSRASALGDEVIVDKERSVYEMKTAMDSTAKGSDDCIYKVGWETYIKALQEAGWNSPR